jgi:hypothetical protein
MNNILQTPAAQSDLEKITQQTMDLMKDAQTNGFTTADGLYGFGLENVAKLIFPLVTPFLNSIPRKLAAQGSAAARWKAIVGFGYTKPKPTVQFGAPGTIVTTVEQDYVAPYAVLSLGDTVQMDAQTLARGFDNLRAKSGIKTLYELKKAEDIIAIGGQTFALQVPGTPSGTYSSTGGQISNGGASAVTWKFAVAARTAEGYQYGVPTAAGQQMSTPASATVSVSVPAGATTGSVTLSVTSVPGAAVYDWYCDNGQGGPLYYTGVSTTVNTVTITAAAPTTNPTAPTQDSSADPQAFNGLIATCVGDYTSSGQVTRGTGTRGSGATIISLDGKTMTGVDGSIQEIDNVLLTLAQQYNVSPTRLIVNPQEAFNMTNKMFATGGFRVMLQAGQKTQDSLVGGAYIESYINKAWQGQMLKIVVDPQVPPGTILGVTDVLPFPDNTIDSVLQIETQQEYQQIEYAMSRGTGTSGGPRYDYEVRTIEVFKNYFPSGCFIIQNVGNG